MRELKAGQILDKVVSLRKRQIEMEKVAFVCFSYQDGLCEKNLYPMEREKKLDRFYLV